MSILNVLLIVLFGFVALLLGYQFLLGILAMGSRQKKEFPAHIKRKFAVIVPAHNEERMIAKTIYSLSGVVYPRKLYDVFVIADNCTDNTAEIASKLGSTVLKRSSKVNKGKGFALSWAFNKIMREKSAYDAFIVIDSDSLVSGNYLEVMNHYLETGSRVIQSSDLVLRQPDNWSIEATRIGFLMYNYVKPLGRKALGLNMGLRGNGMCFATEVLKKTPWQAWSLTEDVEYGLILIQRGETIEFAPEATVWAQMPVKSSNAESQRSRWEMGRFQIIRGYALSFLIDAFKKRSWTSFDVFIDLITPPYVNLMLATLVFFGLGSVLLLFNLIAPLYVVLWGVLAVSGVAYLFLCLYVSGADRQLYKSILHLPKYVFWKIHLYIKTFRKGRELNWIRTERDSK